MLNLAAFNLGNVLTPRAKALGNGKDNSRIMCEFGPSRARRLDCSKVQRD